VSRERVVDGEAIGDDISWEPWTPVEVAARLVGTNARWYVVAGWALDLFIGRQTRVHDDIEIGVPRSDFSEIRTALGDYDFEVVDSGRRWPLASDVFDSTFQTWLRDPKTGAYHLDVFRDPHDGSEWICRRDERIRLPYSQLICHSKEAIPYMAPEFVLLFKAKSPRDKDQMDFDGVVPLLGPQQVAWLRASLELVHPGHPWAKEL
jgi:hypothetical protein